jgi:hypothetical protein
VRTNLCSRCVHFARSKKPLIAKSFFASLVIAAAILCSILLPPLFKKPSPAPAVVPAGIRMLVIGDSGVGDPTQKEVARQMSLYASSQGLPFDALLHVGDVIYWDGDPQYFHERITVPYLSPPQARTFLVALGNHDRKWSDSGDAMLAFANLSSRYYEQVFRSSDGASLQLLVLDSNSLAYWPSNPSTLNTTFTAEQTAFLDSKLAEGPYTWRVVSFHHPVFSCARHKSSLNVSVEWLPVMERRGNVDLVLSGHDHK